jgi:hypothetical protein
VVAITFPPRSSLLSYVLFANVFWRAIPHFYKMRMLAPQLLPFVGNVSHGGSPYENYTEHGKHTDSTAIPCLYAALLFDFAFFTSVFSQPSKRWQTGQDMNHRPLFGPSFFTLYAFIVVAGWQVGQDFNCRPSRHNSRRVSVNR